MPSYVQMKKSSSAIKIICGTILCKSSRVSIPSPKKEIKKPLSHHHIYKHPCDNGCGFCGGLGCGRCPD